MTFIMAVIVFVLITFCGWALRVIFDAGKQHALPAVARLALRIVPRFAPRSQRGRIRQEVESHLECESPARQVFESVWLICRLLAVRASARELEQFERHGLAMADANLARDFFAIASAGRTGVAPDEEPILAMESVRNCQDSMLTMSYREEDWWPADEGRAYLTEQKKLMARGGRVERIFIVAADATPGSIGLLQSVMRTHASAGVAVYYVYEVDLPPHLLHYVQDFILYDNRLLRTTVTVPHSGLQGRDAQLHTEPVAIRKGQDWFERLKNLSVRFPDRDGTVDT